MAIVTDLSNEPVRAVPKPQRTEKTRDKGRKTPERSPKQQKRGEKEKRPRSALADMKKVNHQRSDRTMSEKGKVTPEVYDHIWERSGGLCEICKKPLVAGSHRYELEAAHLIGRKQGGRGDQPWMMAMLCGPSVNTGTCHNVVDYTAAGKRKARRMSNQLKKRYNPADWPE